MIMANDNNIQPMADDSQIVLYQPNESVKLEVKLDATHETVWLTQQQIADLFGTKRPAITKHLGNIFKSGELNKIQLVPFWNILPLMAKYTGHSSIIWMQLFLLDIVSIVSMLQPFESGQRVC